MRCKNVKNITLVDITCVHSSSKRTKNPKRIFGRDSVLDPAGLGRGQYPSLLDAFDVSISAPSAVLGAYGASVLRPPAIKNSRLRLWG